MSSGVKSCVIVLRRSERGLRIGATKNPLPFGSGWLRAILSLLGSGQLHPHRSGEQAEEYAENKGGQAHDLSGHSGACDGARDGSARGVTVRMAHGQLLITGA